MMKTIVGTYNSIQTAHDVANDLISAGYSRNDISIVANDANNEYATYVGDGKAGVDVAPGAGIGAGPVIAAGPLLAALTGAGVGAVTGGVVGALVDLGIPDEEAHIYAEGLRRGNVLVIAQVPDTSATAVTRVMYRPGLIDIHREAETWRASGWNRFDETDRTAVYGARR